MSNNDGNGTPITSAENKSKLTLNSNQTEKYKMVQNKYWTSEITRISRLARKHPRQSRK
jgi:hypothetical protein